MRSIMTIMMLGLVVLSSHSYAGITKWTDADGKVHYSDQPAPKNVKATNITIEDPMPVAPDAKEKLKSYQNVIEDGRKKRVEEQLEADKISAKKKQDSNAAKLEAEKAKEKEENDAAIFLNSGSPIPPDGYTPLAAPAAPASK